MIVKFILAILSIFDIFLARLIKVFLNIYSNISSANITSRSNTIFVVRIDNKVGDMVIFSDFIRKLYLHYPKKRIVLVVHKNQKDLYKNCPYVSSIFFFDWGKSLPLSLPFRSIRALYFILKNDLYGDWHFGISGRYEEDFHAAFLLYLSGAKERIGYSSSISGRKKWSMFLIDSLFTITSKDCYLVHEAYKNLYLLESKIPDILSLELKYETWQSKNDLNTLKDKLRKIEIIPPFKIIAFGIGAYEEKKMWPLESYAKLINMLSSDSRFNNYFFLLLGSGRDKKNGEDIFSMINYKYKKQVKNLAGTTSISDVNCILALTKLFIGNDSGLLHSACANAESVIGIWCHSKKSHSSHSLSPDRFGPVARKVNIIQPEKPIYPCARFCKSSNSHCISQIKPEEVYKIISQNKFYSYKSIFDMR